MHKMHATYKHSFTQKSITEYLMCTKPKDEETQLSKTETFPRYSLSGHTESNQENKYISNIQCQKYRSKNILQNNWLVLFTNKDKERSKNCFTIEL